jgi:hypothetical protein
MNKQQKEQIRREFLANKKPVMVSDGKWRTTLDEYMEQESYARPVKPQVYQEPKKIEYPANNDLGILAPDSIRSSQLAYLRLSVERGIDPFQKSRGSGKSR